MVRQPEKTQVHMRQTISATAFSGCCISAAWTASVRSEVIFVSSGTLIPSAASGWREVNGTVTLLVSVSSGISAFRRTPRWTYTCPSYRLTITPAPDFMSSVHALTSAAV